MGHTHVSPQLTWEIVKGWNSFVRHNLHGNIFSAEKGNLYAKHSYKHSGIANDKAVDISEGAEGGMHISMKRLKTAQKPTEATTKVTSKKHARRAIAAARKQVASYRKDLQNHAVARASAVHRALRKKAAKQ